MTQVSNVTTYKCDWCGDENSANTDKFFEIPEGWATIMPARKLNAPGEPYQHMCPECVKDRL